MSSVGIIRIAAQFFAIPVMARYLTPEEYGLVALAMPFVLFAIMFADAGLGESLVRTEIENKAVWVSSFWVTVGIGLILTLLMVATAWLAAFLLAEPRLLPIIATLGIAVFFMSLSSIPGAALRRQQKYKIIALIDVISLFVAISIALIIVIYGGGVWALVVQQLVHYGVRMLGNFIYLPFRLEFKFSLNGLKEHLFFSRDVVSVNLITFISQSFDTFFVARILGTASLGYYSMAFLFARLPGRLFSGPLHFVGYSYFSRIAENTSLLRNMFLFLNRILASFLFPVMGMVAVAHEPIFRVLLSEKWADAGTLYMLLAAGASLQAMTMLFRTVTFSISRSDIQLRQSLEYLAVWFVCLLIAVGFGMNWAAIAFNISIFVYLPRQLKLVLPLIECSAWEYLATMMMPTVVTLVSIAAYSIVAGYLLEGDFAKLALAVVLSVIALVVVSLVQYKVLLTGKQLIENAELA